MKPINYKKETLIFTLSVGVISFILFNLQAPKSKQSLKNELGKIEQKENKKRKPSSNAKKNQKPHKKVGQRKSLNEKIDFTFKKIKSIEACLEVECDYPDNDPREYSLSVYKNLSLKLAKYKGFWSKSWTKISDQQKGFIVGLLAHDDGFVKKEILSLLSSLPPEEAAKYLDVVLDQVVDYHDSELIAPAMDILKASQNSGNELAISTRLSKALKEGGPHVSQAVSKGIHKFISPNTASVFEKMLPSLPESAPETTYLTSALTEYEMQQSGG